jgi:hypothetical protein
VKPVNELVRLREIKLKESLGSHLKRWVVTGTVTMAKSQFTSLVNASFNAHVEMTQNIYRDSYQSSVANAREVRTNSRGAFDHTKNQEVFLNEPGHGGIALIMHVHNFREGSTIFPNSIDDWTAVRKLQAPMLFTSEPLHQQGMGVFVTPNGHHDPTEHFVDLNR